MPDETDGTVQPNQGQGDAGNTDAPYSEYLNRIPEEVRGDVEPIFKEWDANTTRRFQEASEFRKAWEPYEQAGVNQHEPAAVEWALQFYNALENPQAIQEWYEQYAQQKGIQTQQAASPPAELDLGGEADLYADPTAQLLEQQLKQSLGPIQQQLEQINSWRQAQEQQVREQEALRVIEGQITDLKSKHPDEFNEAMVEKLVAQYIETDPQHAVQRAFGDWQAIVSQIQKDTLQSKVNAPPPAESGGLPDGAPEPIRTLKDANRIALEQIRQAHQA